MNAQNSNMVYVIDSSSGGFSPPVNAATSTAGAPRRFKKNNQQPVVDIIVVLIALPSLTILALLLESSTRGNWLDTAQSRYTVLGLGFALAIVCLSLCIYVTTRLGGKIWSGAIPSDGSGPSYSYYSSRMTVDEFGDKPPSYEVVMGFEAPPPAYHTIIIDDEKVTFDVASCSKMDVAQHI